MKILGLKVLIVVSVPFCMTLAFVCTLAREIKSAFWFAGNAAMQECEQAARVWRDCR